MVVKNFIRTCMGGHSSWKPTTSPLRWSVWKISQRPLHDSRECSSVCSSMTWSSCTDQAKKCFWRTPSAVFHPEQTPRSSWIYESMPYQPSHSPRDVSPRLQQKRNETPSSRRCTGSPWTVGPTDKVVSPERPNSTGVSETSYPSMATSSPRVNEWSFHHPAETASSWTSMEAMQVLTRQWTWLEHVFTGRAWKQTSPTTSNGAWRVSRAVTYQWRRCTPWGPSRTLGKNRCQLLSRPFGKKASNSGRLLQ